MNLITRIFPIKEAYAHCDIPCGIYDPHAAQVAVHTVIRMTSLIKDLTASSIDAPFDERKEIIHKISRYTKVKEEHAEIIKHEVAVLWGDYFKEEHFKANPELTSLVQQILKLTSKTRQEINPEACQEMLSKVQELAEIFYRTKGRETKRVRSPYPTEGELVVPK
jgi:nickel superoxide dismutase